MERRRAEEAAPATSERASGPPDRPSEARTGSATEGTSSEVRKHLISLGTNVTVITALLVYFGWKRSDTQSRVLGVDESIFGMSTVDYVLRSVHALFRPIGVGATEHRVGEVDAQDAQDAQDAGQLYRYEGLRLLEHIDDRFFLISDGFSRRIGWTTATGT